MTTKRRHRWLSAGPTPTISRTGRLPRLSLGRSTNRIPNQSRQPAPADGQPAPVDVLDHVRRRRMGLPIRSPLRLSHWVNAATRPVGAMVGRNDH